MATTSVATSAVIGCIWRICDPPVVELEAYDGTTLGVIERERLAAVRRRDVGDDREAEARPGLIAREVRAVEAIEDVGEVGRADAGAAVAHFDPTTADRHLDRVAGGVELGRVV